MFSRRQTVQVSERCSLDASGMETMEDFRVETLKALWQAFDSLDTTKSGLVHVSQLKVITSNIGMKIGIDKGEELLNKDGVISMDFNTYFAIVKSELIDKVDQSESPGKKSIGESLNSIIKTCWTFCNFERLHKSKWLSFEHCLVLWRLFNFLSETDETGEPVLPVQLHSEEANMLLKQFVDTTGQKNQEQSIKDSLSGFSGVCLCFTDFLNVFEKDCVTNLSKSDITHGLNDLQDTYLLNILGKALLNKRGYKVKHWKERWFVMTPTHINYYVSPNEKVLKGTIEFDGECSVELLPDRVGHKQNRFIVKTNKKPYEISAPDMKTKNEWVSGLGLAFDRVGKTTNIQKEAARGRCQARLTRSRELEEEERRRREAEELMRQQRGELDEERKRRLEDEELLRQRLAELEEEKKRREEAEARAREEQALKEAEMQKLRELEEIKRELERLLEEERQAKRDEEIVRSLQARLLEEEFERREELEQLKQKQDAMLVSEREQKALLESDRQAQEEALRQAQDRLAELERQRVAAEQKMQDASDKLHRAEKDRQIMEEKVKLWKTPVGLARLIKPTANPFITHRGQGAFCDKDFGTRVKSKSEPAPDTEYDSAEEVESNKEDVTVGRDHGKDNEQVDGDCQQNTDETTAGGTNTDGTHIHGDISGCNKDSFDKDTCDNTNDNGLTDTNKSSTEACVNSDNVETRDISEKCVSEDHKNTITPEQNEPSTESPITIEENGVSESKLGSQMEEVIPRDDMKKVEESTNNSDDRNTCSPVDDTNDDVFENEVEPRNPELPDTTNPTDMIDYNIDVNDNKLDESEAIGNDV